MSPSSRRTCSCPGLWYWWRGGAVVVSRHIKLSTNWGCFVVWPKSYSQCSPVHPVDKQLSHVMAAVRGDHGQTYSLKEGGAGAGLECGKAPLTWMAFNSHRLSCHSFRANDTYYLILWVYLCNVPSPCTNGGYSIKFTSHPSPSRLIPCDHSFISQQQRQNLSDRLSD